MIEIKRPQELARLRRRALAAQGLLQTQHFGTGISGAIKAINHIGYVQLDTISVVERAHNHVFYSRVPKFKPEMTNQMLINGDIFEYWTHAAALIPIADYRFSLLYKNEIKSGRIHWYKNPDKKLMRELLTRIRLDGSLRSRDLENSKSKREGWWDWKPAKRAIEQLYMQGELMVSNREGFQKTYDLTERVLPTHINSNTPSTEEFAEHLIEQQLRCHAFASLKGLTYLRRNSELREAVKTLVNEKLSQGTLEQLKVNDGEVFLVKAGALDSALPRIKNRMLILSPFDNSVIQRDRLKALFQYDYKLECYVPAVKRQYGYFSLPLLFRDEFIGRMDCKVHRKDRHLEIKSLHWEQHSFDEELVVKAFVAAIKKFKRFQECDSVTLIKGKTKKRTQLLHKALKQLG